MGKVPKQIKEKRRAAFRKRLRNYALFFLCMLLILCFCLILYRDDIRKFLAVPAPAPSEVSDSHGPAPAPSEVSDSHGPAPAPSEVSDSHGLAPAPSEVSNSHGPAPAPSEISGHHGLTPAAGISGVAGPETHAAEEELGTGVESVRAVMPDTLLEYAGEDVIEVNGNVPYFTENEIETVSGEVFSELDELGRCGPATALLHKSMRPKGNRDSIRDIRPSGWKQEKYPGLVDSDPPYLWNRCHLIAYGLTGQGANEKNLITGSRYMNATTMLPYEQDLMYYLEATGNHVLYRVTPHFKGSELVARGVEMEAWSVEDHGASVCFHVFVYNVQPGIVIDYRTGGSRREE